LLKYKCADAATAAAAATNATAAISKKTPAEMFSECWRCFIPGSGKSMQQQFDELYFDEAEETEEALQRTFLPQCKI
jgi:hypothetical protein